MANGWLSNHLLQGLPTDETLPVTPPRSPDINTRPPTQPVATTETISLYIRIFRVLTTQAFSYQYVVSLGRIP